MIFTRARVSLALLSLWKNGGLLVVYTRATPFPGWLAWQAFGREWEGNLGVIWDAQFGQEGGAPSTALGEKEIKSRLGRKKIGERSEPRGSLERETVDLSTFPDYRSARFARLCSPIFFLFEPVFCLFPHCGGWSQISLNAPNDTRCEG